MSSLLEMLGGQLGGSNLKQISEQLGTDEGTAQNAIGAALPALLGVLSRNAEQTDGAERLHGAIQRDHDGSLLDNIGGFLGGGGQVTGSRDRQYSGSAILDHMLGGKKARVEQGVAQASGLSSGASSQLLKMLAPVVMGAIGKKQREGGLDANGLSGLLKGERETMERAAPQQSSLLGRMLDQDGDGDFDMSDMMKFGMGKLFGRQ